MMRMLYTVAHYLLLPVILLRLVWRARLNPAYLQRWHERFGRLPLNVLTGGIWVHAVSVGEVVAAVPLIERLLVRYPGCPIRVTTMTVTGSERLTRLLGDRVQHSYVPYDLPDCVCRYLDRVQPKLCVIMETELWPNMLNACRVRRIPVLLANARLSMRSARGYAKIPNLTRQLFAGLTVVATQYEQDARCFRQLGLSKEKIRITGSLKFELPLPENWQEQAQRCRLQWGKSRLVWIAASTHPGEEAMILAAYQTIKVQCPSLLLVLVPRHPERFTAVAELCKKNGLQVVRRSEQRPCEDDTDVFLGDSMGELAYFYAAADVAFVGGSLVPVGGHNLLEPAAAGVAVLTGPHVFNFAEITRLLCEAGATVRVADEIALTNTVLQLLNTPAERMRLGQRGQAVVNAHRGALDRLFTLVEFLLSQEEGMVYGE